MQLPVAMMLSGICSGTDRSITSRSSHCFIQPAATIRHANAVREPFSAFGTVIATDVASTAISEKLLVCCWGVEGILPKKKSNGDSSTHSSTAAAILMHLCHQIDFLPSWKIAAQAACKPSYACYKPLCCAASIATIYHPACSAAVDVLCYRLSLLVVVFFSRLACTICLAVYSL